MSITKRKRAASKPLRAILSNKPTPAESLARDILHAIRELHVEDPFMLAAVLEWVRQEWRGSDKLQDVAAVSVAMPSIKTRAKELFVQYMRAAARTAAADAICGAVNS